MGVAGGICPRRACRTGVLHRLRTANGHDGYWPLKGAGMPAITIGPGRWERPQRSLPFSVPHPQCRAAGPQSINRGTIVDDAKRACRSVPSGRIRYIVGTRPGPSSLKTIH